MALVPVQGDFIEGPSIRFYNKAMILLFEVLEGDSKGSFFRITPGKSLGRSQADILLIDSNISGLHAKIEIDNKNQLVLMDANSSNGIYLNMKKVKKVALRPGVRFQIGKTLLTVKEVSEEEAEALAPSKTLQEQVFVFLRKANRQPLHSIEYFEPTVIFDIIQGLDLDRKITLGFGPRIFGSCHYDIELSDPSIPDQAFVIYPKNHRAYLRCLEAEFVIINQQKIKESLLSSGDTIEIGDTILRLSL